MLLCCVVVLTNCVFVYFLSSLVYRYLDGIESENERSEVVVDLARELTDLGLDPQIFLYGSKTGEGMQKCKRGYYDRTGPLPGSKKLYDQN